MTDSYLTSSSWHCTKNVTGLIHFCWLVRLNRLKKVSGKQTVIKNQIPGWALCCIVILKEWFVYVNYINTTQIQYIFKGQKTHLPNPGKVWNPHHCGDMASVNKQCNHLHTYSLDWRGTSSESDRERGHWNGNSSEVVCGLQSTSVTNKQLHTTLHIWKHLVQLHSFRRCRPTANTVNDSQN